jgi:aminocarboxymuconate-semialdehyde decarboxylase
MPYQIGRFMHGYNVRAEPKENTRTSPEAHFRRFYFDSLTHHPQATRHLIDMAGAERIVIGTDHPFDMGPADPLAAIEAIPGLTPEEREYICELTALDLLGERGRNG